MGRLLAAGAPGCWLTGARASRVDRVRRNQGQSPPCDDCWEGSIARTVNPWSVRDLPLLQLSGSDEQRSVSGLKGRVERDKELVGADLLQILTDVVFH